MDDAGLLRLYRLDYQGQEAGAAASPVAVAAGIVPMLGMLMLPKTICYILMIWAFLRAVWRHV